MYGVTTEVYAPKTRAAFTMARYNRPDIQASIPSLPKVCDSRSHLSRTLCRFPMNYCQSYYFAVKSIPIYLKYDAVYSGYIYTLKASAAPAHASSSSSRRILRSEPHAQIAVVGLRQLSAEQCTNMSKAGHRGWGQLHSSIIIILSCKWQYTK